MPAFHRYTCPLPDCGYPLGECPGSCLVPRSGLPIDLVEPCPPRAEGDRVPCHLFMPEVAWSAPLGPVLRTPRRELVLQTREPWRPVVPDATIDVADVATNAALSAAMVGLVVWLVVLVVLGVV